MYRAFFFGRSGSVRQFFVSVIKLFKFLKLSDGLMVVWRMLAGAKT